MYHSRLIVATRCIQRKRSFPWWKKAPHK